MSSLTAELVDQHVYRKLVAKALPHVIHTVEDNDRYLATLEALHDRGHLTPEEEQLAELLTLLIEDFEENHYHLKRASPTQMIRELMAANNLKQADLLDAFGSASVASEVLNGKRDFAKSHIEKLSRRFNISPELFF
jgi:HTH-type transcriptional regulator/antitoxin HigA